MSVCIPAYARPAELREAITSALDQTVAVREVLVGDDSGDLQAVVDDVADPRVVYVRNEPRLGMAANWTALLDRAKGSYLALLMDDDTLEPTFVEKCLAGMSVSPGIGVSFSNHYLQEGTVRRVRDCRLPAGCHPSFLIPLMRLMPVAVSAALMRRSAWQQVSPLPDLLTADLYLHCRLAALGWSFYYVDEPLMTYRVHSGQLTGTSQQFREDGVRLWEILRFDDPAAERVRERALAQALISRAGQELQAGDTRPARRDLGHALRLSPRSGLAGRTVAMLAFAALPAPAQPACLRLLGRGAAR